MVLTDSDAPRRYWSDLKRKLRDEGFESYEHIVQLKMRSLDGKRYATDAADAETMLRIVQSIPSDDQARHRDGAPFLRWLLAFEARRKATGDRMRNCGSVPALLARGA